MTKKTERRLQSANFLEGRANARPQNFGAALAVPFDFSLNEFGAQKFVINHWLKPMAWVVLEHTQGHLTSAVCASKLAYRIQTNFGC